MLVRMPSLLLRGIARFIRRLVRMHLKLPGDLVDCFDFFDRLQPGVVFNAVLIFRRVSFVPSGSFLSAAFSSSRWANFFWTASFLVGDGGHYFTRTCNLYSPGFPAELSVMRVISAECGSLVDRGVTFKLIGSPSALFSISA